MRGSVAMQLYRHPRIEVIVAGGTVRRAEGALIGSTAVSLIGQFKVDYAIIGASAIGSAAWRPSDLEAAT